MAANRVATFFDHLRESQLLNRAQLEEIGRHSSARTDDPNPLAKELVQRSWLTAYQASLLLQGRPRDLMVGPYRIIEKLGEGAMGFIYKAQHTTLARTVALKVIRKERLAHPNAVKRFLQEARAAAQLAHPNIVQAYDVGQDGDIHYLAMEYIEGIDLARMVKDKGPLPVEQACDYIRQAAQGLQHASDRGLIHRDIKPPNLMVTRAGVVKILDLGLARMEGPEGSLGLTRVGTVVGTPEYLAPEQAKDSHRVDIRADLYSLGCTLYFLLTGRPPFTGDSFPELLLKHQAEEPPPLEKFRPEIAPQLWLVVKKLLAKKPEDRYQTPADLALALTPFLRKGRSGKGKKHRSSGSSRNGGSRNTWAKLNDLMSIRGKRRRSRSLLPMALALLSLIAAGAAGAYLAIEGNPFVSGSSEQTSRSSEAGAPPAPPDTPKENIREKNDEPKTVEPKIEPKAADPKIVDPKTVDPKIEPKTVDPKMVPKIETKVDPKDEPKTNPKPEPKTEVVLDPGTGKYLVPQPGRLLDAQKQVREKFRDEYAKSKIPERMALADKLLAEAGRTKDDPVTMYVLFHEAGDQAFYAGDLDYCLRVVDEMDRRFLIPANEMRISLLEQASQSKLLPLMKKIAERALELAEQLVSENNYSDAGRVLTIARTAADRGKLPTLAAQAEVRKRDVADIGREYDQAQRAFETLTKNSADADANLKWGKFVCWYKDDWNAGLPFLTRGSDAKLRLLASTDLGKPTSPKVQVQLGDGWWDQAEANQGLARKNILLRSRSWYEKALPQMPVGEFERFRVEKRVKEIPNLISRDDMPTRPDPPPILPLKSYERQLAIGENSLNLRQYAKAIEGFSEALKFKPGDAAATKGLNDARYSLHMTNGYTAVNRKDYDRAVAEFQSALKYRPNDPQGSAALQQARFKKLTEKN